MGANKYSDAYGECLPSKGQKRTSLYQGPLERLCRPFVAVRRGESHPFVSPRQTVRLEMLVKRETLSDKVLSTMVTVGKRGR